MNLKFEEEKYLALYLEFFNRCYNLNDERKYDTPTGRIMLVRHLEVQNIEYFLQALNIFSDYGYCWNWYGPYCEKLQNDLKHLDQKEESILEFYENYNKKRQEMCCRSYQEQLQYLLPEYLTRGQIARVSNAIFVLENILSKKHGSEYLADILYIGKTIIPGRGLAEIIEELKNRGIDIPPQMAKEIWRDLATLGLRHIEPKVVTRQRTLEKEQGYAALKWL